MKKILITLIVIASLFSCNKEYKNCGYYDTNPFDGEWVQVDSFIYLDNQTYIQISEEDTLIYTFYLYNIFAAGQWHNNKYSTKDTNEILNFEICLKKS